jgi:hypothetical protein
MKTHFPNIPAIANAENTTAKLRASTLEQQLYLINISRQEI